jgi:DNA-binding response OmpR family regulator
MPSVLLVDPDRNFREALAVGLRLDGFLVGTSDSADEAARFLGAARFDACLADAFLHGLDGLAEAAERTGARLVLTGTHEELIGRAARRLRGALVLAKPFRPAELAARIVGERSS